MLERVLHMIDLRSLSIFDAHLDDVEAPWQIPGAQSLEPVIRSALDQPLFVLSDCIEAADFSAFLTGFHFDEKQQLVMPGDDVHLATMRAAEIFSENLAAMRAEPGGRDPLSIIAKPDPVVWLAISCRQATGRVERRAETSDDGGNKGRESGALQDALSCHIPGVSQSRIEDTRGLARA